MLSLLGTLSLTECFLRDALTSKPVRFFCPFSQSGESDQLFLHQCWHRAMAVSLVEVSALRLPNLPGGIAHEAFKDSGLLRQVAQIAAASYNRMTQPNYEQQLYEWLWEVMLTLRLHPADLPVPVMQFTQQLSHEELQGNELVTEFIISCNKL